jgi:dipeptidyl aminopeptidase/acylaminoacyl peptidase
MTRVSCLLVLAAASGAVRAGAQVDYHRADLIRTAPTKMYGVPEDWGAGFLGLIGFAHPNWLPDSTRFWYTVKTPRGREFVLVDPTPTRATRRLVFDNGRLAAALSLAADSAFDPGTLPFRTFAFLPGERAISVRLGQKRFECDLSGYQCAARDTLTAPEPAPGAIRSPDQRWDAFVRGGNIWVRRAEPGGRDSIQLTTDAETDFGYGLRAPDTPMPNPDARRPQLVWSPDSRKIAVLRIDERGVQKLPVYSSTGIAPKLFQYPVAFPADSIVPTYQTHVLDVERKTNVRVDRPKQVLDAFGLTGPDQTQWSPRSDRLYLLEGLRANKGARVVTADATTGAARVVLADSNTTFFENASGVASGNWRVVGDSDLVWWSERDGWGHFYRYGLDGVRNNQITRGPWLAERLKYVDPTTRQLYFLAFGRDSAMPYYGHLMRVGLDGTGLTDLTPEPGHHLINFVPSGKAFVDNHSRLDFPGTTTLRSAVDGRILLELERADASAMLATGWTPPTPFKVKARDGVTDLYGLLYLPSRLDTTKRYPVIDRIYPGPQVGAVTSWGYPMSGEPRALAELGFAVVEINALGTPGRSKAFHDAYYGNMGDNGIADHVTAIKQLGVRHRFLDLDRVGIYGLSGGGFSSTGAILRYPDFFKVAVSGAGNHDNRSYRFDWGEKYQGRYRRDSTRGTDNFESQANYLLAGNLKGRLLLFHGDMDTNVHPAMTLRLVDALIKADKDFDMFIIPDAGHIWPTYMVKRGWDHFVKWLLGGEPPRDFRMTKCEELICQL